MNSIRMAQVDAEGNVKILVPECEVNFLTIEAGSQPGRPGEDYRWLERVRVRRNPGRTALAVERLPGTIPILGMWSPWPLRGARLLSPWIAAVLPAIATWRGLASLIRAVLRELALRREVAVVKIG